MNQLPASLDFIPEDKSSLKLFGAMLNKLWQLLSSNWNSIFPPITYTPTVSSSSGALGSANAVGRYRQIGKLVFVAIVVNIVNNGTGTGAIVVSLPIPSINIAPNGFPYSGLLFGRAGAISGKVLQGYIAGGISPNQVNIETYDNLYPGATGEQLLMQGFYEIA